MERMKRRREVMSVKVNAKVNFCNSEIVEGDIECAPLVMKEVNDNPNKRIEGMNRLIVK